MRSGRYDPLPASLRRSHLANSSARMAANTAAVARESRRSSAELRAPWPCTAELELVPLMLVLVPGLVLVLVLVLPLLLVPL